MAYREEVIEHFENPKNVGSIENSASRSAIKIQLKIRELNGLGNASAEHDGTHLDGVRSRSALSLVAQVVYHQR